MNKMLIACALSIAAFSAAFATGPNWFNGNIGDTASGGAWSSPLPVGVTLNDSPAQYELDNVETNSPLSFAATDSKSAAGQNLEVKTTAKFAAAYVGTLPDVPEEVKAGVVAYDAGTGAKYYVLAKSGDKNAWTPTTISADVDAAVGVTVTISNGAGSAVFANYKIGDAETGFKEIVALGDFRCVQYCGSGAVSALEGSYEALGYPIPGGKTIERIVADAWAEAKGIAAADLAAVLASDTVYAQGRTAAQSCLLGVGTNETVAIGYNLAADSDELGFSVNATPVAGRATFQLKKNGTAVGDAQAESTFTVGMADGDYTIVAFVDGEEVQVAKTVGVKTTAKTTGTTYCAVPYVGADGETILVKDLFKTKNLTSGDQIDVFDPATGGWLTFSFGGTAWDGVEKDGAKPKPETVSVRPGQAFKFTAAAAESVVAIGYKPTGTAVVSTVPTKYVLLAPVDGSASFALTKLAAIADKCRAVVVDPAAVLPSATYKKVGDVWKKVTTASGVTSVEAAEVIPAGTAFFLLDNNTVSTEIEL